MWTLWARWTKSGSKERFSHFHDISGPHGYQQIALPEMCFEVLFDFIKSFNIDGVRAGFIEQLPDRIRGDADRIDLARGVDRGENHVIRCGQRLREGREEKLCPGVCVRLENDPELFVGVFFSGSQCCGDFRGWCA